MNKRKITRKSRLRIIGGMGIFILGGGLFLGHYFTQKEEVVSAHPTQEIILDSGGTNELTIPKDGTRLWETGLASTYDDYVQTKKKVSNLTKNNLETISDWSSISYETAQKTSDGNWIIGINFRGDWYNQNDQPAMFQKYLVKVKNNGEILKIFNVATHENFFQSSADTFSDGRYAVDGGSLRIDDGKVSMWYKGFTPNDKKLAIRKIILDENLNFLSSSIGTFPDVPAYSARLFFTKDILTKDTWYTGNSAIPYGQERSYAPEYSLLKVDPISGSILDNINLKYPKLYNLNSSIANITKGNVGIQGSKITKSSDGGIIFYGRIYHEKTDEVQINNSQHIIKFSSNGSYLWSINLINGSYTIEDDLSTSNKLVVLEKNSSASRLLSIDTISGSVTELKEYPFGTNINITKNSEGAFDYYGNVVTMTGEFIGFVNGPGAVMGTLNSLYSVESANFLYTDSFVSVENLVQLENTNNYFMYGYTQSKNFSNIPNNGWQQHRPHLGVSDFYMGSATKYEDYSPLIKSEKNISIDITDTSLETTIRNSYNWTVLDNWLITGEKDGIMTSTESIKVYDTNDYENISIGASESLRQKWLEERINRNSKDLSKKIDWKTLGFDKTNTGPQLVTYFVSDSQNQISTTSRWINKKTPETIIQDDYALEAQNFAVSLKDVSTNIANENDFKKLAKTNAWYMATSSAGSTPVVDEESVAGNFNGTKVKVDVAQLAAVQNAKEAKPYPVDVSYDTDGDGNFDGSEDITNRVWVFVTTKNTKVDQEADTVIYADDYEIPYRLAASETDNKLYSRAKVKVYQYTDSTHETDVSLPTIADKDTTTGLSSGANPTITTAPNPGTVQPTVSYHNATLNKTATTTIEVTLTSNVLVHVKQEIVSSNSGDLDHLPIPSEGYLTLSNDGTNRNVQVPSGKEGTSVNYANPFYADFDYGGSKKIVFEPTIPEFYSIKGYVVTTTNVTHHSSQIGASDPEMYTYDYLSGNDEVYLTIYLTPKLNMENQPQLYHWDEKENDLGTIKLE